MWLWYKGRLLRRSLTNMEDTTMFFETLRELSNDKTLPQYATHLVYLTGSPTPDKIEEETIRSILEKNPKRADVYWFVHVKTDNEPFTMKYCVKPIAKEDVYHLTFTLGFRIEPRLNYFFELALRDMVANNEVRRRAAIRRWKNTTFAATFASCAQSVFEPRKRFAVQAEFHNARRLFLRHWFSIREDAAYGLTRATSKSKTSDCRRRAARNEADRERKRQV
jgi:K+ transporter